MNKSSIAATTTAEEEPSFIAGMPNSPQGSGPSRNVVAIRRQLAFPRATASKGEAGMSDAFAEGASQMVSDLQRKIGADPFVSGIAYELSKEGIPSWIKGLIRKPEVTGQAKSELQVGISKLKARLSAAKPQLTPQRPMPHEELSFPVDRHESHFRTRMDAKASKGRWEPSVT